MISIFGCGRKSFQLDARFRELLGAVQSLGIGGSMYHSGGEGKPVSIVNDKDQLVPYRQLDASRLKIVGSGNWDCRPFLDELFYMPFVEPAINTYDIECPRRFAPDLSRCDPDETLPFFPPLGARSLPVCGATVKKGVSWVGVESSPLEPLAGPLPVPIVT